MPVPSPPKPVVVYKPVPKKSSVKLQRKKAAATKSAAPKQTGGKQTAFDLLYPLLASSKKKRVVKRKSASKKKRVVKRKSASKKK